MSELLSRYPMKIAARPGWDTRPRNNIHTVEIKVMGASHLASPDSAVDGIKHKVQSVLCTDVAELSWFKGGYAMNPSHTHKSSSAVNSRFRVICNVPS